MKRLLIILSLFATPSFADGPSALSDARVYEPVCAHQFLFWKWEGKCYAKHNTDARTDGDGVSDPVHRTPSLGKPTGHGRPDKPRHERDPAPTGEVTPDKPKADKPKDKSKDKPTGNASANNGKGGNYDKTGHDDNGNGQGRNKKPH